VAIGDGRGWVAAMWVSTEDRQDKEKGGEDDGRGRGSSQVGVDGGQDDKEIEKQWLLNDGLYG